MGTAASQLGLIPSGGRPGALTASGSAVALPPARRPRGGGQAVLAGALILLILTGSAALPILATQFAARSVSTGWAIASFRLRAAPDDGANRLLKLPAGAELTLLGKPEGGYYPVSWGGVRAWAPTGMVETPAKGGASGQGGPRDRKSGSGRQEIVAASALEVRAAAASEAAVLGSIARGDPVDAVGDEEAGYLRVRFGADEGWVEGNKLQAPKAPKAPAVAGGGEYKRSDLIGIIHAAADRYDQDREAMVRVARCESDLIPGAINAVGGSYGLFQFKPQTWARTPYAEYDIFDPVANAMAAAWLWSQGGKVEWVCQ